MIYKVENQNEIISVLNYFKEDLPSLKSGSVVIPDYAKKIFQFGNMCVFMENSLIKGFAVYYSNDRQGLTGYLSMIAVKPAYQNIHIGSRLLGYVEEQVNSAGMNCLKLEVRAANLTAISFYEKHGFKRCGMTPNSYYYHKYIKEGM